MLRTKPDSIQGSFDFEAPSNHTGDHPPGGNALAWIKVAERMPYFVTDEGDPWTPVGQNDAVTWPDLAGAFRRKDLPAVDNYFAMLAAHGVNCLRLMLEYCQTENRYLENPAGRFQNNMVRFWDDIFLLCEKYSMRVLLTPYDTFWMWRRWSRHPYNHQNSGPCVKRSQWLLCPSMRNLIKQRLHFVTERWGSSGAVFAWDLWNEIRPMHSGNSSKGFNDFIADVGNYLRQTEIALHGRAHPQSVSVFSPVLQKDLRIAESVFHHNALDFATIHMYEHNTIDNPKNTIDPAISTGKLAREVISQLTDNRPFFDSEHGPIKTFNTHRKTLPAAFDEEYFRHMQWAHIASGGAGGGMRWPYRYPHTLTKGMRTAQLALSRFLPLIAWEKFDRVNLNEEIKVSDPALAVFGCGNKEQAIVWLLRTNAIAKNKMVNKNFHPESFDITVPLLQPGDYDITLWDTLTGNEINTSRVMNAGLMRFTLPGVVADMAVVMRLKATMPI